MSRIPVEAVSHKTPRLTAFGSAVRALTPAGVMQAPDLLIGDARKFFRRFR